MIDSNINRHKARKRVYTQNHEQKHPYIIVTKQHHNHNHSNININITAITSSTRIPLEYQNTTHHQNNEPSRNRAESNEQNIRAEQDYRGRLDEEEGSLERSVDKQGKKKRIFRYFKLDTNKQTISHTNKAMTIHSSLSKSKNHSSQSLRIHKIRTIAIEQKKESSLLKKEESKSKGKYRYANVEEQSVNGSSKNRESKIASMMGQCAEVVQKRKLRIRGQKYPQNNKNTNLSQPKAKQNVNLENVKRQFEVLTSKMKKIQQQTPPFQQLEQQSFAQHMKQKKRYLDDICLKTKRIGSKIISNLITKKLTLFSTIFFAHILLHVQNQQSIQSQYIQIKAQ